MGFVHKILNRFGPRRAGSPAERQAQEWLAAYLSDIPGVNVKLQEFRAPLRAKFASSRLIWPLFWLSLGLAFIGNSPFAAFSLAFPTAVAFFLHFVSYRHILDFLYRRHSSLNVFASLEPLEPPCQTIILSGHMDSTPEFIWWYLLGQFSASWMVLSGALLILWPLHLLILLLGQISFSGPHLLFSGILYSLAAAGGVPFVFIHGRRVVPGAQDNLSGVACALAVFEGMARNGPLRRSRLVMASFGAEETGLRGSHHFVRQALHHFPEGQIINLNLDGILLNGHLNFITAEPSIWVRHHKELIQRVRNSFQAVGIQTGAGPL
ncbi:MAG: M20/M25/M40 family metallo-hydrolase, partial [Flavobacteriales bacterium]|nr:M20/M25/M40 family metallo-hydrolase [Flavobacteriales bacterium]